MGLSMPLLDHLLADRMMIDLSVNSKKQLLERISAHAGQRCQLGQYLMR